MTPPPVFYPGRAEPLKIGVHVALGGLAVLCFGYNLCAFAIRRETHLFLNAWIYAGLTLLEIRQMRKHQACGDESDR